MGIQLVDCSKQVIYIIKMRQFTIIFLTLSFVYISEAGFRCFFGDSACSLGCKILGQKTGLCDDDNKCWCSEQPINLNDFRELLPSRCTLGEDFCQITCHAIGRRDGASESTCRADCQRRGKASGRCDGWRCECLTNLPQ